MIEELTDKRPPDFAAMLADVEEPERLSATTLIAAERCMLAAYLSRFTGNPSGEPAIVGSHFHDIAAQVGFQAQLEGRETFSPDEVEKIALRVLANPVEREARPLSRTGLKEVLAMARSWASTMAFPVSAETLEVEISVRHELAGQIMSGRIDLLAIDGAVASISDYKTGRVVPTQTEVEEEHTQLPTYAWHVLQIHPGVEVFNLTEIYVRSGARRSVTYTLDDVLDHERWLKITAERIRRAWKLQAFEAVPGKHCKYCPLATACPLPEVARPDSIVTDDQAKEQMSAILSESARLAGRKKVVRSFLTSRAEETDEPEIHVGDATARIKVNTIRRFDRKAAEADGIDLTPYDGEAERKELEVTGT